MGLLDILNGMQNGPRGPSTPSAPSDGKEGMSPMTMAILALLAWKAVKHFGGSQPGAAPSAPPKLPGNVTASLPGGLGGALSGGGLSDLMKGGLGGLLAGGAAGSILSGGLGDLLKQFQEKGQGDTASTWVSNGPNKQIAPGDLASALGADQIEFAVLADRSLARRSTAGSQPVSARRDQSSDAGWKVARTSMSCQAGFDFAIPRRGLRRGQLPLGH